MMYAEVKPIYGT